MSRLGFVSTAAVALSLAAGLRGAGPEERQFAVTVDAKPAGTFLMRAAVAADGTETVQVRTDLTIKTILGSYAYSIRTIEVWKDDRLVKIDSAVNDDGKKSTVKGEADGRGTTIVAKGQSRLLSANAVTSTGWKVPKSVGAVQDVKLLDTEDGTETIVRMESLGTEKFRVGEAEVEVTHVRLTGKDTNYEWWTDPTGRPARQRMVWDGHTVVLQLEKIVPLKGAATAPGADLFADAPADPPADGGGKALGKDRGGSLLKTLDALGAGSGIHDGAGMSLFPARSVPGQRATFGFLSEQAGLTVPVHTTPTETILVNASARSLNIQTEALLPTDRVRFPNTLSDVQFGGGWIRELDSATTAGVFLGVGSASDALFHSVHEMNASALAFYRTLDGDTNAWLFYVVSSTNGQVGGNIPIPGIAYEFKTDQWQGVIGLPFLSVTYRPVDKVELVLDYAAVTDVLFRTYYVADSETRLFAGFTWWSQSWFRAGRTNYRDQLFRYEKRFEAGVVRNASKRVNVELVGGYAFDRYFAEIKDFSLTGRNRVDIAPGLFFALQVSLQF